MDHLLSMEKELRKLCAIVLNVLLSFERTKVLSMKFFENWIMWGMFF